MSTLLLRTLPQVLLMSYTYLVLALYINFIWRAVFVPTTCSCYVTVNPTPLLHLVHPTHVSCGWVCSKVNCDRSVVKPVVQHQTKDKSVVLNWLTKAPSRVKISRNWSGYSLPFVKTGSSLPCSQEPAIGRYSEPGESNVRPFCVISI
jgi:hypothetical protein